MAALEFAREAGSGLCGAAGPCGLQRNARFGVVGWDAGFCGLAAQRSPAGLSRNPRHLQPELRAEIIAANCDNLDFISSYW